MEARDYQLKSFDLITQAFVSGSKKVLLWLSTGGGKTFIFCTIAKRSHAKGKKVAVVVRGRKLVDQASKRLFREQVPHGVHMAAHWNYRPMEKVQVCSIDTLRARDITLDVDLLILDEAHLFNSPGDKEYLARYKNIFMLSVTASPYCDGGLRHVADTIVRPTTMMKLIEDKHLVPFKYFGLQSPDLSEVRINKDSGEYVNDQLDDVMFSSGQLAGEILETWITHAHNLATVVFTTNIKRSKALTKKFVENGIAAEHMDADTPEPERELILKRHEDGITKVIFNVGILCTGVDMPWLRCVVLARAINQLNLFIQQCGRLTRNFPGKDFGILIDHGGNLGEKHGLPTDEPDVDLDGKVKTSHVMESKKCKRCWLIFRDSPHCPDCGPVIRASDGELDIEVIQTKHKIVELVIEVDPVKRAHLDLLKEAKKHKRRPMWASYKIIERFGLERARPYLTDAFVDRYNSSASSAFSSSRFRSVAPSSDEDS